jgi:hypothetical protein
VVPSSDFHHSNPTPVASFDQFDGGWQVGNNAGQVRLIAPVKLPHDATVNSFTMYYVDNSTGLIECNLLRALITASDHPGSNALGATASTEQDALDHFKTDVGIVNPVIDNTAYYYYVYVGDQTTLSVGRATAHPNPFRAGTAIEFSLPSAGPVSVDIYDLQGRLIRTIRDPFLPAGSHRLSWDGLDEFGEATPSGVYFAQVKGENRALAAKLVRVQ